jgi:hypothetical protein
MIHNEFSFDRNIHLYLYTYMYYVYQHITRVEIYNLCVPRIYKLIREYSLNIFVHAVSLSFFFLLLKQ